MAETKTRKLERIFWDISTKCFCSGNGAKRVKTIVPVGKMCSQKIKIPIAQSGGYYRQ
ncbi:MAG: hypothetical protein HY363_06470 [Candidatus Aenigmarchaeota archaeon]|nr:hypothetical protein [Candidatus Aenigmarchaeota archaeon]